MIICYVFEKYFCQSSFAAIPVLESFKFQPVSPKVEVLSIAEFLVLQELLKILDIDI